MKKYQGLIDGHNLKRTFLIELTSLFCGVLQDELKNTNFYSVDELVKFNLTQQQIALIGKVHNMLDKGNGLKDVIIMINSFSRGTKRLKTNPYNTNEGDLYEWTNKDGNEKYSHKGNIPNAHFRWDYGQRYTLSEEDLRKISLFIKPLLKYIS